MSKNFERKKCKKCSHGLLLTLDNHDICKPCRQPLSNVFECFGMCQVCEEINSSPCLAHTLRKYELKRMKKIASMSHSVIESKEIEHSFKKENELVRSFGNKVDGDVRQVNKHNLKDDKIINMQFNKKYSYGTRASTSESSLSEAKNKLSGVTNCDVSFDSSPDLTTSANLSGQSLLHINKPEVSSKTDNIIPEMNKEKWDLYHKFCEFLNIGGVKSENNISEDNLVSVNAKIDSNLSENHSNAKIDSNLSENHSNAIKLDYKKDGVFKVSPKACDILLTSTILSSPLQADYGLRKKVKLEKNCETWPSVISYPDLLDIHTDVLPGMKLHPKVRHLQKFLFGKLSPSFPQDILSSSFILPPISLDLENKFLFARKQLQRSLFLFSMLDNFYSEEKFKDNVSGINMFEKLFCHLKDSIESQGNLVGLLLQDIRKDLLQDVVCQDNEVVTKLITGSVDETQFFGPYVKILQTLVKNKGPSYCLKGVKKPTLKKPVSKPSLNLAKLPKPFEIGSNVQDFLKDLKYYFFANEISEEDKVSVLQTLLPSTIVEKITMFLNSARGSQRNFDEISNYFERIGGCGDKIDYLSKRFIFTNLKQETDQSIAAFVKELKEKIIDCNYGLNENEFLRDQFVFGLKGDKIREELMDKYYFTFEQCCSFASSKASKIKGNSTKTFAKNNSNKVLSRELLKIEDELSEQPCMKKKLETKEIVKLHENNLNDPKAITASKRKLETEEMVKLSVKKVHFGENLFYSQYNIFYDKPKLETVNIKSKQQWHNYFGTEAVPCYKVLCPWTGKILRT